MGRTADDYLEVLRSWIGYSEKNGKFREIIDIYNSQKALPRGYKVSYEDAWCDVTVSAAAIRAGMEDLIGCECGCEEHIRIFQEKGIWKEDGTLLPEPGYLIVYNWNGVTQPNDGYADHIGVVEKVENGQIICIEGNYKDSVCRRMLPVGWGYIRGYAAPEYEKAGTKEDTFSSEMIKETDRDHKLREKKKDTGKMTDGQTGRGDLTNKSLQKDCKWKGIVTVNSWLSVRKWAGIVYETCSFSPLLDGTVVEVCDSVLDKKGEVWYYINYKGKYGFVHSAYIRKKE